MQFKSVLAVFLVTAGSALAAPPACLLAAVNQQGGSPSDFKAICGRASGVQKVIQQVCGVQGNDANTALAAFADTCKSVGITVPTPSPLSTASATTNKDAAASSGSSASSSAKPTGSGSAASTLDVTGMMGLAVAGFVGSVFVL